MARSGRPPIAKEQRKAGFLNLRLAASERVEIDKAAEIAGKPATTWAREILLAQARQIR